MDFGKQEIGFVVNTQDYLVWIAGLPTVKMHDIIKTGKGSRALVVALSQGVVEALMLDPERPRPGMTFALDDSGLRLPVASSLIGRMINPLGEALDGGAVLPRGGVRIDLDTTAPGIEARSAVNEQFFTGITAVDTLLPIGKGQRELVMCEPRSGKRAFFLDVILSQKDQNRICIYAAVGRSEIEVRRFFEEIQRTGAADYTVVIAATSEESAPLISVTPAVSMAIAEHFRDAGQHVLLIMDDLATHAKYAREISLLSGRVPGRESYPADIFYQHSSLVERAGNFNDHFAGGSITLLPAIVTTVENFTNLIPTNVMSMTDGHLLFVSAIRATGQYPAIEIDRSVTRVGRQTQWFIHKVLSDKVRLLLAEYHELERYGRFGSELSTETQLKIKRGKVAEELLRQEPLSSIKPAVQILLLSLVFTGFFDQMEIAALRENKAKILRTLREKPPFTQIAETVQNAKFEDIIAVLDREKGIITKELG